jgi:hypothetical protein
MCDDCEALEGAISILRQENETLCTQLASAQRAVEAMKKIKAELNEFDVNSNVDCRIEAVINEYDRKEREGK